MEIFFKRRRIFELFMQILFVGFYYNQIFKLLDLCTVNIPAKTKEGSWS